MTDLAFAANLTMLYTERPFLERFAAAAADGFAGAEFVSTERQSPRAVAVAAQAAGLPVVLVNGPTGDWAAGERGIAALPGRDDDFAAELDRTAQVVRALDVPLVNVLAGRLEESADVSAAESLLVERLLRAADRLEPLGARVTLEHVNVRDVTGYALPVPEDVERIRERAGRERVGLQLDVYHAAMQGLDPVAEIEHHLPDIAHVQIADVPGRHEPGTGELDFPSVFAALRARGYTGWVSGEYVPRDGAAWIPRARARR